MGLEGSVRESAFRLNLQRLWRYSPTRLSVAILLAISCWDLATPETAWTAAGPRKLLVKPSRAVVSPGHDRQRINVKFQDDLVVDIDPTGMPRGPMSARAGGAFDRIRRLGGHWRAMSSMDRGLLRKLRFRAEQSSGRGIADLASFFTLRLPPNADTEGVTDALNELPEIELAAPAPVPVSSPSVPDFEAAQGYLDPAPGGLASHFAWTIPGGTGEGVTICDVEGGWNLQHEDLPPATVMIPIGESVSALPPDDHGTEVLGTMFSLPNGWGTTGASYGARCAVAPVYLDSGYGLFQQILWATSQLEPGDIILIEESTIGPYFRGDASHFGYVPVEWEPEIYNAILTAVGIGIHVVEPAGNGSQNLDDPVYAAGNYGHAPFLPGNNSGAIMVGAGIPPTAPELGADRSKSWFSNFGSRLDVQGWGHRVATTGAGDLYSQEGPNRWFTGLFGGTSSAAPLVASAIASIEGIVEKSANNPVPPSVMRNLLVQTGTPQQGGTHPAALEWIGPRPDLEAAIQRMSAPIIASPHFARASEGDTIRFTVFAADLDGDPIDFLNCESLPPGAFFQAAADNSYGLLEWPTQLGQAGAYSLVFFAGNTAQASDTTHIELGSVERAPVITAPGYTLGIEGRPVTVTVLAADPNGDPIVSFAGTDLPRGATFHSDSTHTSGVLTWTPDFDQAGQYVASFTAISMSAGLNGAEEVGHGFVGLTIFNGDRAPAVTAPQTVDCVEGQLISFTVSAMDPDGEPIQTLYAANLPPGASFVNTSSEVGTFTWTPDFNQSGSYLVAFHAESTRNGLGVSRLLVANTDRPPAISTPSAVAGTEGVEVAFDGTATDPDGDPILTWSGDGLPVGSTLSASPNQASVHFAWTPRSGDAGHHIVRLNASSGPSPGSPTHSDSALVDIAIASGHFAARVRLTPGEGSVRLGTGGSSTCILLEPVDGAFDLAQVDPSTIRLHWAEGGSEAAARALPVGPLGADRDGNGVQEIELCFPKEELRHLFAGLQESRRSLQATVAGSLLNGGEFEGPVDLEIITQLGIRDAAVTPNPSRTIPTLTFHTQSASRARLAVFDVQGRLVGVVLNWGRLDPGFHDVPMRAGRGSLRAGIYYYRLEISDEIVTGRFAILR